MHAVVLFFPHSITRLVGFVCVSQQFIVAGAFRSLREQCLFFSNGLGLDIARGTRAAAVESTNHRWRSLAHRMSWLLREKVIREVWDPERFRAGTPKPPDAEDLGERGCERVRLNVYDITKACGSSFGRTGA